MAEELDMALEKMTLARLGESYAQVIEEREQLRAQLAVLTADRNSLAREMEIYNQGAEERLKEDSALENKIAAMTVERDAAYHERNKVVAALSKIFPASLERHVGEDWGPDWLWVCIIDLPTGQVSWHIHSSELELFSHLKYEGGRIWDGHTTDEKYMRLAQLSKIDLAAMTARLEKAEAVIEAALDYLPSMVVKSTNLDKLAKLNSALSAWQEASKHD